MSETLVVIMNVSCTQWFLTGGARLPKGASSNFQGGASPYMLCNIERFLTGMCPFQTWFSAMWPYTCMILTFYSSPSMFFCDETRGGSNRPPLKPTKVTLFTIILNKSENNIRDIRPFSRPVFVTAVL